MLINRTEKCFAAFCPYTVEHKKVFWSEYLKRVENSFYNQICYDLLGL